MVYLYQSQPLEDLDPHWIITGKDKFENDLLIKYGYRELKYHWFHVDKYSSAHIYLKLLPTEKHIDDVPKEVMMDCLQLCKSKSIYGNKLLHCTLVHTPLHNLKKSRYMKPGEVSFKSMKSVKQLECYQRDNKILNRLMKTRIEIIDGIEQLLHGAKLSKDTQFLTDYVTNNRDMLVKMEGDRRIEKKRSKQSNNQDNDD